MKENILDKLLLTQTNNVEKHYRIIYITQAIILYVWVLGIDFFSHQSISAYKVYLLLITMTPFVVDGLLMPHSFINADTMRLVRYHNIKTPDFYQYFIMKVFSLKNIVIYISVVFIISIIGNFITELNFFDYFVVLFIGLILAGGFSAINSLIIIKNLRINKYRVLLFVYNIVIFALSIVFVELLNYWLFIPVAITYSTIVLLVCNYLSKRLEVFDL